MAVKLTRLWATADEAKRAELIEAMLELATKYGGRVPVVLRQPGTGKAN